MGKEFVINQEFTWEGEHWRILSLDLSASTTMLRICKGVEDEEYTDGCSSTDIWDPVCSCDDPEWTEYQAEVEKKLEHYHLDKSWGWSFHNLNCKPIRPEDLSKGELILHAEEKMFPGDIFTIHGTNDEFTFTHPVRKTVHTLRITDCEQWNHSSNSKRSQFPQHSLCFGYEIIPDLTDDEFWIMDCGNGDGPQPALLCYDDRHKHTATAHLYHYPVTAADITWRMCFYDEVKDDIRVPLQI